MCQSLANPAVAAATTAALGVLTPSRDQRVLLELHVDRARIAAFLDWRPGARLPADAQGNHLLVGKADRNEASIRHVYADAKPTLTITRSMDKDQQV